MIHIKTLLTEKFWLLQLGYLLLTFLIHSYMHITSLAYFPVLVKVLHNELPWKCPKLDGLSTLFCIIVGNMTLYHTINTLCISTDYLVTRWQRLLVHNSGYFHKTHLFKVTNDPPVLFLHYRKRYSGPLESESATRTQIVEVPWNTWADGHGYMDRLRARKG